MKVFFLLLFPLGPAGPDGAVGGVSDSRARGPGFDTQFGHLLSFLLPLIKDGQLAVMAKVLALITGKPFRRSMSVQE